MADMATAVFVGRLTRDAELKYTNGGAAVARFSIATGHRVQKQGQWVNEPSFWDINLWGKQAESLTQYLTKGKSVAVSGDIKVSKWQDNNGVQHSKVECHANTVCLLGGGGERQQAEPAQMVQNVMSQRPQAAQPPAQQSEFTDDIPF